MEVQVFSSALTQTRLDKHFFKVGPFKNCKMFQKFLGIYKFSVDFFILKSAIPDGTTLHHCAYFVCTKSSKVTNREGIKSVVNY